MMSGLYCDGLVFLVLCFGLRVYGFVFCVFSVWSCVECLGGRVLGIEFCV